MAQAALLEREYQTSVEDEKNTPEAIAHRKKGAEIYNTVFQSKDFDADRVTAAFSLSSASVKTAEPSSPAYDSAPAVTEAPVRKELFSNLEYKEHTLRRTDIKEETAAPAAPVFTPAPAAPVHAPAPEVKPAEEENEDLRPTRRTMETLQRAEIYERDFAIEPRHEERVGFFASLSSKAKMVLAIVSALIVVAIAIVCINTGIINSIKADLGRKQEELEGLSEYSQQINSQIDAVTDPSYIDDYAEHELGMTRS